MRTVPADDVRERLVMSAEEAARRDVFAAAAALTHLVFQHEMSAEQARARLHEWIDEACDRFARLTEEDA